MKKVTCRGNTTEKSRQKAKNDLIIISVLALIVVSFGLCFFLFRKQGDTVIVTVDGQVYKTFSLNSPTTYDIITGNNTSQMNRLVIEDGKAYVSYASCPDGICSSHRAISRSGESIVCLPNKVVITVKTGTPEIEPDVNA